MAAIAAAGHCYGDGKGVSVGESGPSTSPLKQMNDAELDDATAQFQGPAELQGQLDQHDIPRALHNMNDLPDKARFPAGSTTVIFSGQGYYSTEGTSMK